MSFQDSSKRPWLKTFEKKDTFTKILDCDLGCHRHFQLFSQDLHPLKFPEHATGFHIRHDQKKGHLLYLFCQVL